jgi:hypothetical protein
MATSSYTDADRAIVIIRRPGLHRLGRAAIHPPARPAPPPQARRRRRIRTLSREEIQGCRAVEASLAHRRGWRPGSQGMQGKRVCGLRRGLQRPGLGRCGRDWYALSTQPPWPFFSLRSR